MNKILLCAMLCSAAALATPVSQVTLVEVPASAPVLGVPGLYASPYTLLINGNTAAGLCIDFDNSADVGQTWNAYLTVDGSDLSQTYHPDRVLQYRQEAYIYSEITQSGISSQQQAELQEAAWAIMSPNYAVGNSTYAPDAAALAYIADAQNNYTRVNPANFLIVSSSDPELKQEFLIPSAADPIDPNPMVVHVSTPEPASCALLGSGLLIAGLLQFFRRSKTDRE